MAKRINQDFESTLTINIIYIRNTVKDLLPLLSTLFEHSKCNYRLVSNACTQEEVDLLKSVSKRDNRILFRDFGFSEIAHHHFVLNMLLELESSKYFAFIDVWLYRFIVCIHYDFNRKKTFH